MGNFFSSINPITTEIINENPIIPTEFKISNEDEFMFGICQNMRESNFDEIFSLETILKESILKTVEKNGKDYFDIYEFTFRDEFVLVNMTQDYIKHIKNSQFYERILSLLDEDTKEKIKTYQKQNIKNAIITAKKFDIDLDKPFYLSLNRPKPYSDISMKFHQDHLLNSTKFDKNELTKIFRTMTDLKSNYVFIKYVEDCVSTTLSLFSRVFGKLLFRFCACPDMILGFDNLLLLHSSPGIIPDEHSEPSRKKGNKRVLETIEEGNNRLIGRDLIKYIDINFYLQNSKLFTDSFNMQVFTPEEIIKLKQDVLHTNRLITTINLSDYLKSDLRKQIETGGKKIKKQKIKKQKTKKIKTKTKNKK